MAPNRIDYMLCGHSIHKAGSPTRSHHSTASQSPTWSSQTRPKSFLSRVMSLASRSSKSSSIPTLKHIKAICPSCLDIWHSAGIHKREAEDRTLEFRFLYLYHGPLTPIITQSSGDGLGIVLLSQDTEVDGSFQYPKDLAQGNVRLDLDNAGGFIDTKPGPTAAVHQVYRAHVEGLFALSGSEASTSPTSTGGNGKGKETARDSGSDQSGKTIWPTHGAYRLHSGTGQECGEDDTELRAQCLRPSMYSILSQDRYFHSNDLDIEMVSVDYSLPSPAIPSPFPRSRTRREMRELDGYIHPDEFNLSRLDLALPGPSNAERFERQTLQVPSRKAIPYPRDNVAESRSSCTDGHIGVQRAGPHIPDIDLDKPLPPIPRPDTPIPGASFYPELPDRDLPRSQYNKRFT